MKKLLLIVLSAVLFAISANAQVQNVNVTEFEKMVSTLDKNEVLLDVRSKNELKDGFIPGMTHMDFYDKDFNEQAAALDKSKTYYVYCAAGGRSFKAAKVLEEKGIKNIYNLNGGIIAWNKEEKKIEK